MLYHIFHCPFPPHSSVLTNLFSLFRIAVVTGANKGIGLEICRQLASNRITVVLTARDGKKGLEAAEKLKRSGCHQVVFHQLDVADRASVTSLADFITTQFGKLDILVRFRLKIRKLLNRSMRIYLFSWSLSLVNT